MSRPDQKLARLLQIAAAAPPEPVPEMPLGFDSRVLAHVRERRRGTEHWQVVRFIRRVALGAVVVLAFASSAAYWQMHENEELAEPLSNAYAIADTVIDASVYP